MKKKLVVSFIASFFLLTSPVFANITAGGSAGVNSQGEQGTNYTKNINRKQTKQKTKTHVTTTGQEESWQKTKQKAQRIVQNKHLIVTVSVWDVVSPVVNFLETHSRIKLFKNCKLLTKPPTFNQLLQVEQDGIVDEIALQYYQQQEKAGGVVSCPSCIKYAKCCALYGAVVGQAMLELMQDIKTLTKFGYISAKTTTAKTKIQGISLEDLQRMFLAEVIKVLRQQKQGTFYELGVSFAQSIQGKKVKLAPNGFYVYTTRGFLAYTVPHACILNNIRWFGTEIAGLNLSFQITKAWSYEQALSVLAQNRRYKNIADATQKQLTYLLERGMAKQYIITLKKAYQAGLNDNFNFDPRETTLVIK